jgi:hypothetical protein
MPWQCNAASSGETQALEIQCAAAAAAAAAAPSRPAARLTPPRPPRRRNTLTSMISAASGDNIMTEDQFESYTSPVGIYSLNTPRNLQVGAAAPSLEPSKRIIQVQTQPITNQPLTSFPPLLPTKFNSNCFFKSPNQPMDCTYDAKNANAACIKNDVVKVLNSTTWGELAENVCANYYPSLSTNVTLGPPPAGQLLVGPISKCQNMTFDAGEQWILSDVRPRFGGSASCAAAARRVLASHLRTHHSPTAAAVGEQVSPAASLSRQSRRKTAKVGSNQSLTDNCPKWKLQVHHARERRQHDERRRRRGRLGRLPGGLVREAGLVQHLHNLPAHGRRRQLLLQRWVLRRARWPAVLPSPPKIIN